MRRAWVCIVVIAGCGSDEASPPHDASPAAPPPTYHADVAPLLARHCASCHREGGGAPFALETYAQAADANEAIAAMTATRQMPPWPADASGACNTFVGQRWLSDAEIATFGAWAAAGAPAGDPADAQVVEVPPAPPFTAAVALGSPAPYTVMPGPDDEYRCFVVEPGLATDRFITAFAVRLDRAEIVHHMQLFSADTDASETDILARDAADPAPGYRCDVEGTGHALRYIGVWAAGDVVKRWPDTTGIRLLAGRRLVVQFHYHNHGSAPVDDRSQVELELADAVGAEATIDGLAQRGLVLQPGLADIEVSRARVVERTVQARAARIHMHRLGTHARIEVISGGLARCVLDIPRWSFGWQLFYTFDQPIELADGDILQVTCGYDTRSRTEVVTWGESTDDEMCIGYVYVTP